jgi:uncharacterized membrane protein (DUF485 family)
MLLILSLFLGWYLLYVFGVVFARDLMAYRIAGNVNVALVFGVLQFAAAFVLAWRYTRHARRVLDPLAARIVAHADERVGAAVRRRQAGAPASPAASAGRPPSPGPTPPDGTRRPFLDPTPPDGLEPPRPVAPPPPRPASWPETAGRPWTGGLR